MSTFTYAEGFEAIKDLKSEFDVICRLMKESSMNGGGWSVMVKWPARPPWLHQWIVDKNSITDLKAELASIGQVPLRDEVILPSSAPTPEEGTTPEGFKLSRCRQCGAPVIWAELVGPRKRIPFDAEPVRKGTFQLDHRQTKLVAAWNPDESGLRLRYDKHSCK